MLNSRPIIVNGFGRGGTNILMNILLSHPDTGMPSGELNKVFKGGAMGEKASRHIFKKIFYNFPIVIMTGQDIFNRFLLEPRRIPNRLVLKYIDYILYREKQRALHESHNLWKDPTTHYTKEELSRLRLTVKAHNGLVYNNDIFREMYNDVRFVAVVRNGFALCEGYVRRGWSLERASELYNMVGSEILGNLSRPDYLCIKFEDMISEPLKVIEKIYSHCDLDIAKCRCFRLQVKSTVSKNKSTNLEKSYDRKVVWYTANEISNYFVRDINQKQISRLNEDDIKYLKDAIGPTMEKLHYI